MTRQNILRGRKPSALTKGGLVKATFSIKPEHLEALRKEAFARAGRNGLLRSDAGEVLREILDAWVRRP